MNKDYLAIELAKIEADAANLTAGLLATQDAFLRGHALVELLIAHGAPEETSLNVVNYGGDGEPARPGYMIYATNAYDKPNDVMNALQDSRAPYHAGSGYDESVRYVSVEGYKGATLILPAALFLPLQESA